MAKDEQALPDSTTFSAPCALLRARTTPAHQLRLRTMNLSHSSSECASNFAVLWCQSWCVPNPEHALPGYSENYARVIAFAPNCGEPPVTL